MAELFGCFLAPLLHGTVLDIGCGPQPVPSYLANYPTESIAGLDPLAAPHPFVFHHGVAEFLPWDDASFDLVITATSLDHVLLLDRSIDEFRRVLKPGGGSWRGCRSWRGRRNTTRIEPMWDKRTNSTCSTSIARGSNRRCSGTSRSTSRSCSIRRTIKRFTACRLSKRVESIFSVDGSPVPSRHLERAGTGLETRPTEDTAN